ncbi:hypothetical protein, partial [Sphingomonas sp.]|uniref:hypothetical protein n=1 Tax=Sphingomonas sp. TaxID=28214 RepID=UPI0025E53DF9
ETVLAARFSAVPAPAAPPHAKVIQRTRGPNKPKAAPTATAPSQASERFTVPTPAPTLNGHVGKSKIPPSPGAPEGDDADEEILGGDVAEFTPNMQERCQAVAKLLLNGPRRVGELRDELGIAESTMFKILNCRWFAKHGYGEYRLTAEGRTAVTGKQAIP